MQFRLARALAKLDERTLIDEVITPLIDRLHPGRIEFTHSNIEAGRDLVSFGTDVLRRPHYLCVQAKVTSLPSGGRFPSALSQATAARKVGITTESGDSFRPHEVWFITSKPFSEEKRRQVAGIIQDLERDYIKLIAGEELASLVLRELPDIARRVARYSSDSAVSVISELLAHREGKIFGVLDDRELDEFYVAATLSPHSRLAYDLVSDNLDIEFRPQIEVKLSDIIGRDLQRSWRLIASDVRDWQKLSALLLGGMKQPLGTIGRTIWQQLGPIARDQVLRLADRQYVKNKAPIIEALNKLLVQGLLFFEDASTEQNDSEKNYGPTGREKRRQGRKILDEYCPGLLMSNERGLQIDDVVRERIYNALVKHCRIPNFLSERGETVKPCLKEDIEEHMYTKSNNVVWFRVPIDMRWEHVVENHKKHTKKILKLCPSELSKNVKYIRSACHLLDQTERTLQEL